MRLQDQFDQFSFKSDGVHLNDDTNARVADQLLKSVRYTDLKCFNSSIPVPDINSETEFPNILKRKTYENKKSPPGKKVKTVSDTAPGLKPPNLSNLPITPPPRKSFRELTAACYSISKDMKISPSLETFVKANPEKVEKLSKILQCKTLGQIAVLEEKGKNTYFLITKNCINEPIVCSNVTKCLQLLRNHARSHHIRQITVSNIPGLDNYDLEVMLNKAFGKVEGIEVLIHNVNIPEIVNSSAEEDSSALKPIEAGDPNSHETQFRDASSPAIELENKGDADSVIEQNEVTVIGFFRDKNSELVKSFKQFTGVNGSCFALGYKQEIFNAFGVKSDNAILIMKQGDEAAIYELNSDLTPDRIKNFVTYNTMALIPALTSITRQTISECFIKNQFFILTSPGQKLTEFWTKAKEMADIFKCDILFVKVDLSLAENRSYMEYVNPEPNKLSCVMTKSTENMFAYKMKNSDSEKERNEISNFLKFFGILRLDKNVIENIHQSKWIGHKDSKVDDSKLEHDLTLAVQRLRQEIHDANQLISVLTDTHQKNKQEDISLPEKSINFLEANQISISTLYTNLVAIGHELKEEIRKKESLVIEHSQAKSDIVKLCSEVNILLSKTKEKDEEIQNVKLQFEKQKEIVDIVCKGSEKVKLLEEEIAIESANIAKAHSKMIELSKQHENNDGVEDQVEEAQTDDDQQGEGGNSWSLSGIFNLVKNLFK